ncbi:SPW repeat domain-containing protein [Solirubrum puertoriconensis]|uniref:SPW repeat-containing integral membrane domain-containing protein n=1 Tax=Solirubrum puertoriconensis TaxID=1751427 RepID=A0A9X0HI99_SOLP1|nr:hypothetical protein [Solirubrum puertoriconensis]KUG06386.1 hypothetical protein ASU33_03245 [Solirubrum puertoriconensis]
MKILSPSAHGVLDYIVSMFFLLAPLLFDLQHPFSTAFYVLGAGYLVVALLTDYPLGWMRIIPFPMHGAMELVSGLAFIALPFIFGFSDSEPVARNLFIGSGIMFVMSWLITDWKAAHGHSHTGTLLTDAGEMRH